MMYMNCTKWRACTNGAMSPVQLSLCARCARCRWKSWPAQHARACSHCWSGEYMLIAAPVMCSWVCACAVRGVDGGAGQCNTPAHVLAAKDRRDLVLQHGPHPSAVVPHLASHRRPLQQGTRHFLAFYFNFFMLLPCTRFSGPKIIIKDKALIRKANQFKFVKSQTP